MKKGLLLLAAVLTIAAWEPSTASSIENCPFYPCENFIAECENPGGTVLSLTPIAQCNFFNDTYTLYQGLCQFPPATFWDEVCFQ